MFLNTLSIGELTALNWPNEEQNSDREEDESNSEKSNSEESNIENNVDPVWKNWGKLERLKCSRPSSLVYRRSNHIIVGKILLKNILIQIGILRENFPSFYVNDWCTKHNVTTTLSRCKFSQMFDDLNLSLFKPKKDLCDTCESFKSGNLASTIYEAHILRKEEARVEKSTDKADPKCLTYTMDFQSL